MVPFFYAAHPYEAREIRRRDELILMQHYNAKRCIVTGSTANVEWAHVIPFEPIVRAASFSYLRALKLFPPAGCADSRHFCNLVPLSNFYHRHFDHAFWTFFPSEETLTSYIHAEEIMLRVRRKMILGGSVRAYKRFPYYAFQPLHEYAMIFGYPHLDSMIDSYGRSIKPEEFRNVYLSVSVPSAIHICLPRLLAYTSGSGRQRARINKLIRWSTYLQDLWIQQPTLPWPPRPTDLPYPHVDGYGIEKVEVWHPYDLETQGGRTTYAYHYQCL